MPPEVLQTLPFGTRVIMLRAARPIITSLRPWTARPDAAQLKTDRAESEKLLAAHFPDAIDLETSSVTRTGSAPVSPRSTASSRPTTSSTRDSGST